MKRVEEQGRRWIPWPTCFKTMSVAPARSRIGVDRLRPRWPSSHAQWPSIVPLLLLVVFLNLPMALTLPSLLLILWLLCFAGLLRLNNQLLMIHCGAFLGVMRHTYCLGVRDATGAKRSLRGRTQDFNKIRRGERTRRKVRKRNTRKRGKAASSSISCSD